jgi:hypothetical protein
MATKMNLVTTKFNRHHWMMNKMDLVATIKFGNRCRMETEKVGIWQIPLLLVLVAHKDGQLKKIWSPSNNHKFSDGDQNFLIVRNRGHATCFWKSIDESFPKNMITPFCGDWKNSIIIQKIMTVRWLEIKKIWLSHLVPFWSPLVMT